jgi:hypothetical protein
MKGETIENCKLTIGNLQLGQVLLPMLSPLPRRILARTERPVPPVLWELTAGADPGALEEAAAAGADWFLVPASVPVDRIPTLVASIRAIPSAHVVVGVTAADLVTRTRRAEVARIDALRPLKCAAVMVQAGGPSEMKSGGPFHRINNLRQQGRCELVFAEAETVADAEWMIANSPAHAVSVPFGIEDQTARWRVLAQGEELGTAVLARTPHERVWEVKHPTREEDLAFVLAHRAVAMGVQPFPTSREEASRILGSAARPIDETQREALWARFSQSVKEPAKPRGQHPPEYGA